MLKPTFQISNRLFSYLTGLSFFENAKMFKFSSKISKYTFSSLHYNLLPSAAYHIAFIWTAAGKSHPKLQQPGRFAFVIPASATAPVTGIPREFEGTRTAPSLGGKCHPQYHRIRNSPHCKIQMAEYFASGRPHCCNIAWLPDICYGLLPTLPLLKRSVRRKRRRSPKSRRGAAMSHLRGRCFG